jgi:hypothetical protein
MIDAKSFMEFFEKEYGVSFVDTSTGKKALDIIDTARECGNCKHILRGDGKTLFEEDMVCGNLESEYLTEFRFAGDNCKLWEVSDHAPKPAP